MKSIPVEQAVGTILCHDITEIVPDVFKGPTFKKGHVITEQDIPRLLDLGKRHIYVADFKGRIHENDAARRIASAACGKGITLTEPVEGKVTFIAETQGLLKVNVDALDKINHIQEIMFATLHSLQTVEEKQDLAGTRIIPLSIDEAKIKAVEEICQAHFPIIEIKPFSQLKVGMVITGSEIYHGRIKDKFGPVVEKKFQDLGSRVFKKILVSDEMEMTANAIRSLMDDGAQMIAVTGGMSVDPDDLTPSSIRAAGGKVVTYGAPVLPGAMFMLAHIDGIPVVGLPGCVMYHRASIFDLVVPRLMAGEVVDRSTITRMGHGGYCSNCKTCKYPVCGFGK
ncbi:MAG: molybdopterin-binding protein [Desulfobacterium sp.]|nr:molybdopterin-binding protein [Desulfobacterium sp.]